MSRSFNTLRWSCPALAVALALAAPAAAQQTDKMAKDTAMMSHDSMSKDAMGKDSMEKDKMGMEKDKMGMEKDKMGMAPEGMLSGNSGHKVAGTVTVKAAGGKSEIELGDDFAMDDAKDVRVVLSRSANGGEGTIDLGKLKKSSGAQSYTVPAGTSLADYSHLVLWSKKDKAMVGTASLASSDDKMHK